MNRLIPQSEMSAEQLMQSSYQAMAIISLCSRVADDLSFDRPEAKVGAEIALALGLARELVAVMHDALETHEGLKGDSQ